MDQTLRFRGEKLHIIHESEPSGSGLCAQIVRCAGHESEAGILLEDHFQPQQHFRGRGKTAERSDSILGWSVLTANAIWL